MGERGFFLTEREKLTKIESRKEVCSMRKQSLLLTAALLLCLTACGSSGEPTQAPDPTPTPTVEATPEPTPYNGPENPLTGLPIDEEDVNKRPVAVMLNNLEEAQPQLGQSEADIIYEVLAEGGITRMLGVFQNIEDVEKIGSVRSARPYYLELALGHDAIFLHAGGSEDAYAKVKEWKVTALDCVRGGYEGTREGGNLFWRDAQRIKENGKVHSVVTTGEAFTQWVPDSIRREHGEDYSYPQAFLEDGTPKGESAVTIQVPYSHYKTGTFTYDETTGTYAVSQYGSAYVDGNTGEQVTVTNVLVVKTDCHVIPGDTAGRLSVDLTSGGEGYYACGGAFIPIRWEKESRNQPFMYYTEAGEPLSLGRGTSYVSIVPENCNVTFE